MTETKIIVIDDDPTGSQTVHSCLLLTRWDTATLEQGLLDAAPLFFVLANTRGMSADKAAAVTREVCVNLKQALDRLACEGRPINPVMVSRSDSTLRGHYPVETDVIAAQLGPFDAHFLVPAFFEGGRFTRNSVHYLVVDGVPVPVHETEFARDSVFGYSHSFLPEYVAEKTGGRIGADGVERFLLEAIRGDVSERLMSLTGNRCCVVDAESQADLDRFCSQLLECAARGRRYLFRCAASLLTSLAQLRPQPVAAEGMRASVRDNKPGAVIVGSHVNRTTAQLGALLAMPGVAGIEVDVGPIDAHRQAVLDDVLARAHRAHRAGRTCVIYTSRAEKTFADQAARLAFGERLSALLTDVVRGLPQSLGFLISKGGITSNDVLSSGLALRAARVLGQILPGCSVVRCGDDHPRYPGMPVVIFPGNVGDDLALARAWARLTGVDEPAQADVPARKTARQ
jgi:uncharacterized protein YgbK (DUF1537 family)